MADSYLTRLLGANETVVLVARQHGLILVGEILAEALLTVALIVLITLLAPLLPGLPIALGYFLLILPLVSMTRDILIWRNRQFVVKMTYLMSR